MARRLVVGYSYYNDIKSIQRGIPTFVNHVDKVFAIDGRYTLNEEGPDYSDDGSTEYLESFPNVTITKFSGHEHDKRNQYVTMCEDTDALIIIDTDEYVISADWDTFRKNLSKLEYDIHGVHFDVKATGGLTEYPRIWLKPRQWKYHNAHRVFKSEWGEIRTSGNASQSLIEGVILGHDDKLRSEKWLKSTDKYQKKMLEYEKSLR